MCGISACLMAKCSSKKDIDFLRRTIIGVSSKLRHRGPDWGGVKVIQTENGDTAVLAHERLTIVDTESGEQPLVDKDKKVFLTVNGEIFNHKILRSKLPNKNEFLTSSDCEVILHGYKEMGSNIVNHLDGQFSFVLVDTRNTKEDTHVSTSSSDIPFYTPAENTIKFLAARDPIGITPLYYGEDGDDRLYFASEAKALIGVCTSIQEFPPGHIMFGDYNSKTRSLFIHRYYTPLWINETRIPVDKDVDLRKLNRIVTTAVEKRLMSDVPWGILLSGGLDSSLVASIASRVVHNPSNIFNSEGDACTLGSLRATQEIHTFSIGLKGSPDLAAAREVSKFLGTHHHEFVFTIDDALDVLRSVIYHLETYDITTIRASTPMFLLARKIKALGFKLILSGEGADELFGGYSYYHYAPNAIEFQAETSRQLQRLHYFDCLRANKSTAAWGLELTVPFLDADLISYVMEEIHPSDKMCGKGTESGNRIEKYILRKAFDTPENPYLPGGVLWRQKEQFSDGVGYGWIDALKSYSNEVVSDGDLETAHEKYRYNTPRTKEAYLYRSIFHELFDRNYNHNIERGSSATTSTSNGQWNDDEGYGYGITSNSIECLVPPNCGTSIACSTPVAVRWNEMWLKQGVADPSGRSVDIHNASIHQRTDAI